MKTLIWLFVFLLLMVISGLFGLWYLGGKTKPETSGMENSTVPLTNQELAEATKPLVQFNVQDLQIAPATETDSDEKLANYITSLYEILNNYATGLEEGPLLIFQRYLTSPNPTDLEKLRQSATYHGEVVKELLTLPVPNEFQTAHLELTNSLTELAQIIFGLSEAETDPIVALTYAEKYSDQYSKFLGANFAIYRQYLSLLELSTTN